MLKDYKELVPLGCAKKGKWKIVRFNDTTEVLVLDVSQVHLLINNMVYYRIKTMKGV